MAKLLAKWKEDEGEETEEPSPTTNSLQHQHKPLQCGQHQQPLVLTLVQTALIENIKQLPTQNAPVDQREFNPQVNYFEVLKIALINLGLPEPVYKIATDNSPHKVWIYNVCYLVGCSDLV